MEAAGADAGGAKGPQALEGGGRPAGVASRYAFALLAHAEGGPGGAGGAGGASLGEVERSLEALAAVFRAEPGLAGAFASPLLSRPEQLRLAEALLAEAPPGGGTWAEPVRRLVLLLVENRRPGLIGEVAEAALAELARRRGEVTAQVRVAAPLSEDERAKLLAILAKAVGREPRLAVSEDPSLLGGFVVQLGSRMFDGSLKGRLERLRVAFAGDTGR